MYCICNSNTYIFEGFAGPADNCREENAQVLTMQSRALTGTIYLHIRQETILLHFNGLIKNTYNLTRYFGFPTTIKVGPFSYVPQTTPTPVTFYKGEIIYNNPAPYGAAGPGTLGDLAFTNFLLKDIYLNQGFYLARPPGDATTYGASPYGIHGFIEFIEFKKEFIEFKKDIYFNDKPLPFGCMFTSQNTLNDLKVENCHTGNLPILIQYQGIIARQEPAKAMIQILKITCGGTRNYVAGLETRMEIIVERPGICMIHQPASVINYRRLHLNTTIITMHSTLFSKTALTYVTYELYGKKVERECETVEGRSHPRHGMEVHNLTSPDITNNVDNIDLGIDLGNFDIFGRGKAVWNILILAGIAIAALAAVILLCKLAKFKTPRNRDKDISLQLNNLLWKTTMMDGN